GDVIGTSSQVRQEVGQLHAALAVLGELARAAEEAGAVLLDEGEAHLVGHRVGQFLAVQLVGPGLRIEQVDLTGGTFEIDADTRLGLGREVRRPRGERVEGRGLGVEKAGVAEKRGQRQQADAVGAGGEEVAAGLEEAFVYRVHELLSLSVINGRGDAWGPASFSVSPPVSAPMRGGSEANSTSPRPCPVARR